MASLDSLVVKGVPFDQIQMPDEVRKAIIDYYKGKGMPIDILQRHYGFQKGISVEPDPKAIRSMYE
ncbi:hypothetical protein KY312_02460 [Candidatus Woesearchaeota archaeon]|nr:hypothetical protein [Candidatus Woesearchaeota archaeon]